MENEKVENNEVKNNEVKKSVKAPVIIALIAVILIAAVIVVVIALGGKKDTYRLVKVDSTNGGVQLSRNGNDTEIVDDMRLQPADHIETLSDGNIVLLVDNDKHIAAKENTKFSIEAVGNENSGSVKIEFEEGEALFTIENKLNENSTFEVNTPNATLSVRGTIFNVVYDKEARMTILEVRAGVVGVERGDELTLVQAGEKVYIVDEGILTEEMYNSRNDDKAAVNEEENDEVKLTTGEASEEDVEEANEEVNEDNNEENNEDAAEEKVTEEENVDNADNNEEAVKSNLVDSYIKKTNGNASVTCEIDVAKECTLVVELQDAYPGEGLAAYIEDSNGNYIYENDFKIKATKEDPSDPTTGVNIMEFTFTLKPGKYTAYAGTMVMGVYNEGYVSLKSNVKEAFEIINCTAGPLEY